jgi:hypothetical protein
LIHADTVSVPWACCSLPRPVRMNALLAPPSSRTVARMSATGTPVTRSTRSGHHCAATGQVSANPVVRLPT